MNTSKDSLIVRIDGKLFNASLVCKTVPMDYMGYGYKKYYYELCDGREFDFGMTKQAALDILIDLADEQGWCVLHRINEGRMGAA